MGGDGSAWPEVIVAATPAIVEALEYWLFTAGALSVTSREPDAPAEAVLEPLPGETPLWSSLQLVGLFEQGLAAGSVRTRLEAAANETALTLPDYTLSYLPDEPWERAWMADFQPMQFGPRFWIYPSHVEPADAQAINLRLDPGLAFGTGTHPTTAQCLGWLGAGTDTTLTPLSGYRVIDYGCGSGVLGIAAVLLGASRTVAIDIDEQALQATRQNAATNGVADRLDTALPGSFGADASGVDLVLANILYQPLLDLCDTLARLVKTGGRLVMAGMLEAQVEPLVLAYTAQFSVRRYGDIDGWALLVATRR